MMCGGRFRGGETTVGGGGRHGFVMEIVGDDVFVLLLCVVVEQCDAFSCHMASSKCQCDFEE